MRRSPRWVVSTSQSNSSLPTSGCSMALVAWVWS
jgi:hypothetical protein